MKNKVIVAVASIASILVLGWFLYTSTKANPDYICVKNVSNQPCNTTSCSAWWTDWKRTCTWTRTTQVAYYLIRTSCEPWYRQVSAWWNVWWNSWRQWADYVNASETCNIVQQDNTPPTWTSTWTTN